MNDNELVKLFSLNSRDAMKSELELQIHVNERMRSKQPSAQLKVRNESTPLAPATLTCTVYDSLDDVTTF